MCAVDLKEMLDGAVANRVLEAMRLRVPNAHVALKTRCQSIAARRKDRTSSLVQAPV
jgi:hypothetical protein